MRMPNIFRYRKVRGFSNHNNTKSSTFNCTIVDIYIYYNYNKFYLIYAKHR